MAFPLLPSYLRICCTQLTFVSSGLLLVIFSFDNCIKYCYCFPLKSFGIQNPKLETMAESMLAIMFSVLCFWASILSSTLITELFFP